MGIFDSLTNKLSEPVFIKDFDANENEQLSQLNDLLGKVGDDQVNLIEKQIKTIQYGLSGEKNVHYELKNSRIPFLCLHDIRLDYKNHTAQFDFIVICREMILVLETKNLVGDISIDNEGNFTRTFKDYKGNIYKKEGMYSPITQNQRHVALLEEFLKDHKLIKNVPILSLIVIAHDKTIVNKRFATEEIQNKIRKYDQLVTYMNQLREQNSSITMNDKQMNDIAKYILEQHTPKKYDYINMLGLKVKIEEPTEQETLLSVDTSTIEEDQIESTSSDELYEQLRQYRINIAKERNIQKLYYVFNNKQLEDLILNQPTTKESFIALSGFGEKKYEEYGEDIIKIIKGYLADNEEEQEVAIEETDLYKDLRQYRYNKASQENIKPYLIFNNNQLEELIKNQPMSKEDFITLFNDKKYESYGEDIINIIKSYSNDNEGDTGEESPLYKELRQYRYLKSTEENLKPYMVFNNKQLDDIITHMPKNKDELLAISGFGQVKVDKYGDGILGIIKKFA
jgi:superfamily II DNA helicase RecQ